MLCLRDQQAESVVNIDEEWHAIEIAQSELPGEGVLLQFYSTYQVMTIQRKMLAVDCSDF